MRKRLALLCIGTLLLGGCAPAEFAAKADGAKLPAIVEQGAQGDPSAIFEQVMDGKKKDDIPYVPLGAEVKAAFQGESAPQEGEWEDYILREDGSVKFSAPKSSVVPAVTWGGGAAEFALESNWMTALSSNSADYAPGSALRGFLLKVGEGNEAKTFAFVLRTDPPVVFQQEEVKSSSRATYPSLSCSGTKARSFCRSSSSQRN